MAVSSRIAADVVVIGAGIVGTAIARELSRYDVRVVLVEKKSDVASGTTKANTALVHAGYDAE
ncbi:MAG: FAD-dependent oxidoreductase, partial [Firmicutes bacterium]|nr:FAD-dependent oxidoreductase [Bacillota bacterium]